MLEANLGSSQNNQFRSLKDAFPGELPLTASPNWVQPVCFRGGDSLNPNSTGNEGIHTMNKNDLISAVADNSGLTKSDAASAVEGVFDAIQNALAAGDEVRLVGFGTFAVAKRKASMGRNPRTGEPMPIKASNQPKFKAGKGLKDAVN